MDINPLELLRFLLLVFETVRLIVTLKREKALVASVEKNNQCPEAEKKLE